jgi:hypothetical protein
MTFSRDSSPELRNIYDSKGPDSNLEYFWNNHTHTHTRARARTHTHAHAHIYIYIHPQGTSVNRAILKTSWKVNAFISLVLTHINPMYMYIQYKNLDFFNFNLSHLTISTLKTEVLLSENSIARLTVTPCVYVCVCVCVFYLYIYIYIWSSPFGILNPTELENHLSQHDGHASLSSPSSTFPPPSSLCPFILSGKNLDVCLNNVFLFVCML